MRRLAVVPLAILHLVACDAGPAADADVSVVDSGGVQIVLSDSPAWSTAERWRLGSAPRVEIGEDRVPGMRRDQFDVEYVQLFDLVKPERP